ncbi:MAG: hypothetical protein A3J66_00800 [Candidatus Magasanikbacteria bacterium RIFCSPHIGHO2_02_FULL_47_14]|uniref:PDZ domain-containing protein n=1 Tax=Candidatus Magasanikbacteria bacterium RIFCSPHIGHO2_02_FULL_47_14 TaxID=1798680 RepID=A0A1F6LZN1_9BACT|nr:MAG: hypothetical protein A3J66_00800 [Candidatus Magasanikbacteria bacterium RIFCSPHIGHO2_02_FULL_47_14]
MLEKSSYKRFLLVTTFVGLGIAFAIGFFSGTAVAVRKQVVDASGDVNITKVVDLYGKTRSDEVSFDQFWKVWNTIKSNYVGQPVNEVDLFYGAIQGMVKGLNDPYSVYFPPKEAKEFADDLSGEFEGIGAEIGIRDKQLIVIAPLPDSPAEKAGLKSGDKILAIGDEETGDITVEEAVQKIRGPQGTQVMLTISRDGWEKAEERTITRDRINVPTVRWEMKEGDIAYVRISYFNQETVFEFDKAVQEMLLKAPAGLVLDLRSNPGGYLDSAVLIASEWIKDGVIVRERFNDTEQKEYSTSGRHRLSDIPTVTLVDEGTASGSEILAGALQDNGKVLVGAQIFGKGSVQNFEVLPDGSALKLTIAKWFTPKDRKIDETGITPDIVLEKMFEEDASTEGEAKDLGLEKAMEVLKSQIQ